MLINMKLHHKLVTLSDILLDMSTSIETGSGQPGHVLSGSSRSDPA